MLALGRLMTKALVEVVMLKMLPAVPVETLAIILFKTMAEEARFLLTSVTTREETLKVARLRLPAAVTESKTAWLEEATWKTSKVGEVEVPSTTKVA